MDPGILFLPAMLLVMYFFFLRPQLRKQKETSQFQNNIKKGSRVVTNGGLHGKVVDFNESLGTVFLDLGKTTVQVDRSSIVAPEGNATTKDNKK